MADEGSAQIKLYVSSVSSNMEIKKKQQKIKMVLDSKRIPYQEIDIASDEFSKDKMRTLAGDNTLLPPQIFNGDQYLGNCEQFEESIETETMYDFLKLPKPDGAE